MRDIRSPFYCQLAKSIQAWALVEHQFYYLYSFVMKGANQRLISATYFHIESFEQRMQIIQSCLKLLLEPNGEILKLGKKIIKKSREQNAMRNKIVHEVVAVEGDKDGEKSVYIRPSSSNVLTIVKGKTNYTSFDLSKNYDRKLIKLNEDQKLDRYRLFEIEKKFKKLSLEIEDYIKKLEEYLSKQ